MRAIPPLLTCNCLWDTAHFGGNNTAYCENLGSHCWQRDFIDQMSDQGGGQWLYSDIAYWDDMFLKKDPSTAAFLANQLDQGKILNTHLMYGSDWYMLANESNFKEYAEKVYIWAKTIDPSLPQRVFQDNTANLYGLHKGKQGQKDPAMRTRLTEFYKKHNVPTPTSWMKKLDNRQI